MKGPMKGPMKRPKNGVVKKHGTKSLTEWMKTFQQLLAEFHGHGQIGRGTAARVSFLTPGNMDSHCADARVANASHQLRVYFWLCVLCMTFDGRGPFFQLRAHTVFSTSRSLIYRLTTFRHFNFRVKLQIRGLDENR
jgi:hypothetical protein